MKSEYEILVDIRSEYINLKGAVEFIALAHEANDFDRWAFIVSGPNITNSKTSLDEAFGILSNHFKGTMPSLIRSIYTESQGSRRIQDLLSYLNAFVIKDQNILKQINRYGIDDGYFLY